MKALPKLLFTALLLALAAALLSACNIKFDGGKNAPPDGTPTEDEIIECDGYTLTVNGRVLKEVSFTTVGAAVKVVVPEGITEISPRAGRTLFNAVSLTIPSTLEKYGFYTSFCGVGMPYAEPRTVEIYDLSPNFDFDLENADYSYLLENLKITHTSENEESILVERDGFMFCPDGDRMLLLGYTKHNDCITIPGELDGMPCALAPCAFSRTQIKEVKLSEGIETISEACFTRCSLLEKVVFPNSLRSIDTFAFHYATALSALTLPEGLTRINDHAFSYCNSIKELKIPDTVEYLGKGFISSDLFSDTITTLQLPRDLKYLAMDGNADTYDPFNSLKEITVHPDNQYFSVVDGVLFNKDISKLIHYPMNKTDTAYTVPETVKEIGSGAFKSNKTLEKLYIPEGVEKIEERAFFGCNGITTVSIPSTVTYIAKDAFEVMTQIKSIFVHDNNHVYASKDGVLFDKAFTSLILYPQQKSVISYQVPTTVTVICEKAFYANDNIKYVTFPEGLKTIEREAFAFCDRLTQISFPRTLEYIAMDAFYSCDTIKWSYTGDWIATDHKGKETLLDQAAFNDGANVKKYLTGSYSFRRAANT